MFRYLPVILPAVLVISAVSSAQNPSASAARWNDEYLTGLARNILIQGSGDKDPETRREVAVALSMISRHDEAFSVLRSMLTDKDYLCREAAITSISELKDADLADLLRPSLEDEVPEVMFAAARALYRLEDPDGKEALIDILQKEEKAQSGFFRSKFRETARRLKTPKSALLFAAEQGVGVVPVPGLGGGYSALSSILTDADFSPRAVSLVILSSGHTDDVRKMIEDAFEDDDWSVKAAAVQITATRNEQAWKTRLIPLFQDSNKKVRFRAAAVYLRLDYAAGNGHPVEK